MAKKNTSTSPKSTTNSVSIFAQSLIDNESRSENSFTVVNEYSLTKDEAKSIKDIRIIRVARTDDGDDVLKAKVTLSKGGTIEYALLHHWEFAAGDVLDKSTITLCNLKDAKGKLKEYKGKPVVYLYGDLD
jgi:hypothetical protein